MLLTALMDEGWRKALSETDATIVAEIIRNDGDLERLIRDKAGLVEPKILAYLARASAHFRMIKLAHDGVLGNDPERIRRYRYPWQLDEVLDAEVMRLQRRCEQLRRAPASAPGPMEELAFPSRLVLEPWPDGSRPA
jgi:hypothetical protein